MEDFETIRTDFNEIASLGAEPKWNHNNCYFNQLLRLLPRRRCTTETVLEIYARVGEAITRKTAERISRTSGICGKVCRKFYKISKAE